MKAVYVDQLAEPDKKKIEKINGLIKDRQAAERFGARNIKEYSYWAWRACGVANVAMILKSEKLWEGKLMELVLEGLEMNGYAYKNRRGEVDIGWKHQCLVEMLEDRGLQASREEGVGVEQLKERINSKYVIASVDSQSGSHLVLIKSYKRGKWIVNDPYSLDIKGESKEMSEDEFADQFLSKAITASYE